VITLIGPPVLEGIKENGQEASRTSSKNLVVSR
jgi:hypothetical protein